MAQLFSPRSGLVVRTTLLAAAALLLILPISVWAFARSPAATGQFRAYSQPVPFAHALHVGGFRIDCLYCHAEAERSAMAGLPPTDVCVPCHKDSRLQTEQFAPLRESLTTGRPIAWRRVTRLPDFVFFNHAVHVRNGVDCEVCHGPVHLMQTVYQAAPLTMEWCLQCHRAPQQYVSVRPAALGSWRRADVAHGQSVVLHNDIERLTSCTTCHR